MHPKPTNTAASHDSEEPEEVVLVEAEGFSEDDENFVPEEESHSDFVYEDEHEEEPEDDFEDDEEEMSIARIQLHDLNTLSHLYRFGLVSTQNSISNCSLNLIYSSHI